MCYVKERKNGNYQICHVTVLRLRVIKINYYRYSRELVSIYSQSIFSVEQRPLRFTQTWLGRCNAKLCVCIERVKICENRSRGTAGKLDLLPKLNCLPTPARGVGRWPSSGRFKLQLFPTSFTTAIFRHFHETSSNAPQIKY